MNDVTAAADPAMFDVVRRPDAGLVLMHMLGEPKTMQDDPRYDDVVDRGAGLPRRSPRSRGGGGCPARSPLRRPGHRVRQEPPRTTSRCSTTSPRSRAPCPGGRRSFSEAVHRPPDRRRRSRRAGGGDGGRRGVVRRQRRRGGPLHDVLEMARVVRVVDAIARGHAVTIPPAHRGRDLAGVVAFHDEGEARRCCCCTGSRRRRGSGGIPAAAGGSVSGDRPDLPGAGCRSAVDDVRLDWPHVRALRRAAREPRWAAIRRRRLTASARPSPRCSRSTAEGSMRWCCSPRLRSTPGRLRQSAPVGADGRRKRGADVVAARP